MTAIANVTTRIPDKRAAIMAGTLNLIADRGFHDTPVSKIAREAGVSAGIIYHYFVNKDALILELYREIKIDLFHTVTAGYAEHAPYYDRYVFLWKNLIHYYLGHEREARFLEQFENSPYHDPRLPDRFTDALAPFANFFAQGASAGVLKPMPLGISLELSFGVATSLAKQHIRGMLPLDAAQIDAAANATWDAIRA